MLFKAIAITAAVAFLAGAGASFTLTRDFFVAKYEKAISDINTESANVLAEETAKINQLEYKLLEANNTIEEKSNEAQAKTQSLYAANKRLALANGGLYDPGNKGGNCPKSQNGTKAEVANVETTKGRLSTEATNFLLIFARDAEKAAIYAQTCSDWVDALEKSGLFEVANPCVKAGTCEDTSETVYNARDSP